MATLAQDAGTAFAFPLFMTRPFGFMVLIIGLAGCSTSTPLSSVVPTAPTAAVSSTPKRAKEGPKTLKLVAPELDTSYWPALLGSDSDGALLWVQGDGIWRVLLGSGSAPQRVISKQIKVVDWFLSPDGLWIGNPEPEGRLERFDSRTGEVLSTWKILPCQGARQYYMLDISPEGHMFGGCDSLWHSSGRLAANKPLRIRTSIQVANRQPHLARTGKDSLYLLLDARYGMRALDLKSGRVRWTSLDKKNRGGAASTNGSYALQLLIEADNTGASSHVQILHGDNGRLITQREWKLHPAQVLSTRAGFWDDDSLWITTQDSNEQLTMQSFVIEDEKLKQVGPEIGLGDWMGFRADPTSGQIFTKEAGIISILNRDGTPIAQLIALASGGSAILGADGNSDCVKQGCQNLQLVRQ